MQTDLPETIGRYRIRAAIGQSSRMVTVYEAWDEEIRRRVALKVLRVDRDDPGSHEALRQFILATQASGKLNHANIVAVYDYAEEEDLAYFVTEYVDGMSLRTALRSGVLSVKRTLDILRDVLMALDYSHSAGVIHRDLKPANIILAKSGEAKLTDFGIPRPDRALTTTHGKLLGTPAYLAPEQFRGGQVDARTDIYAVGVILYEMLTGRVPFDGSPANVMRRVLEENPRLPSDVMSSAPAVFDGIVLRAMAKRPQDRFPRAKFFAEALEQAVSEDATALRQPLPPQRLSTIAVSNNRRFPPLAIGALLAVGALASAAAAIRYTGALRYQPTTVIGGAADSVPETMPSIPPQPIAAQPVQQPPPPVVAQSVQVPPVVAPAPKEDIPIPPLAPPMVSESPPLPELPMPPPQPPPMKVTQDLKHALEALVILREAKSNALTSQHDTPANEQFRNANAPACHGAFGSAIGIAFSCAQAGGGLVRLQVIGVAIGSPADRAGVRSGDVIVGVNGSPGDQPDAITQLAHRVTHLDVVRHGGTYRYAIK